MPFIPSPVPVRLKPLVRAAICLAAFWTGFAVYALASFRETFKTGTVSVYDFHYANDSGTNLSASMAALSSGAGQPQATVSQDYEFAIELDGELRETVVRVSDDTVLLKKTVAPRQFSFAVNGEPVVNEAAIATLAEPVYVVKWLADGSEELFPPQQAEITATGILKDIFAARQFNRPRGSGLHWTAREFYPDGLNLVSYRANFVRSLWPGLSLAFVKKSEPVSRDKMKRMRRHGGVAVGADFFSNGIVSLVGRWGYRVFINDAEVGRTQSSLRMSRTAMESASAEQLRADAAVFERRRASVASQTYEQKVDEAAIDLAEALRILGVDQPEGVWAVFQKEALSGDKARLMDSYVKLQAAFIADPDLARRAVTSDAMSSFGKKAWQLFVMALRKAGHVAAQTALRDLLNSEDDSLRKAFILREIGDLEHPNIEIETAVAALAGSGGALENAAQTSLAAMAFRLRDDEPLRAAKIAADLVSEYESLPESRQTMAISWMGISGVDSLLPLLLREADSVDEHRRAVAVYALRLMRDARAAEALCDALQDPAVLVRRAAIDALGFRYLPKAKLLRMAAIYTHEQDVNVRGDLRAALCAERRYRAMIEKKDPKLPIDAPSCQDGK